MPIDPPLLRSSQLSLQGLSRSEIDARLRPAVRLARGVYAEAHDATPQTIHRLRVRALLQRLPRTAASHLSAACIWNLPVRTQDLETVHLAPCEGRRGRPKAGRGYRMHSRTAGAEDVLEIAGITTTTALRTVIDCARMPDPEWGVVIGDAALHAGIVTPSDLADGCAEVTNLTGARRVRTLPSLVSALAESPGESLLRLRLRRMGLDPAEQVVLSDVAGRPRVDFLLDGLLVVEFDGRAKYAMAGDVERAHWDEKRRQDAIVEAGYEVIRITWDELWDEPQLSQRIQRALARARRRAGIRVS